VDFFSGPGLPCGIWVIVSLGLFFVNLILMLFASKHSAFLRCLGYTWQPFLFCVLMLPFHSFSKYFFIILMGPWVGEERGLVLSSSEARGFFLSWNWILVLSVPFSSGVSSQLA
jgi:hypothetical protein